MAERRRAVIWSPEARADLSEIWDYYVGVAGPHTADEIVRGITEVCTLLEEHRLPVALATRCGLACDQWRPVHISSSIA